MTIPAQAHGFAEYDDRSHKYLSDNRLAYFDQSRRTTGGVVAPLHEPNTAPEAAPGEKQ